MRLKLPLSLSLVVTSVPWAVAAPPDFKKDIQPIFKAKCYECHSVIKGKKKSGYAFDDLKILATDIGRNSIIEPGNPESPILQFITSPDDAEHHMPPDGRLSASEVKKIRDWIVAGAVLDPKAAKETAATPGTPATPATPVAPAVPAVGAPPMQKWSNAEGQNIDAALIKLEGETAVLRLADGKIYRYPLAKLSPASQEQARKLAPR